MNDKVNPPEISEQLSIDPYSQGKDGLVISDNLAKLLYRRAKYIDMGDLGEFQKRYKLTEDEDSQLTLDLYNFCKTADKLS